MTSNTLAIVLAFISFVVTTTGYPKVLSYARRHNIVDNPNARKLQRVPVPVMGGTSIIIGILAAAVVGFTVQLISKNWDWSLVDWRMTKVMCLLAVMYAIGFWDDVKDVSPALRFLVELMVVWAMILMLGVEINDFHGLWGIHQIPDSVSVPLSLIAGVGIMNAVNLIDGVDGYCSSYGIMACIVYASLFAYAGDKQMFTLALIGIGALLPFFFHNVFGRTSKMFLGDGGSLMLGTLLALFTFTALSSESPCAKVLSGDGLSIVALCLAILAVPVFDTLRVMIVRIANGRSPFHPDKTHLHHVFVNIGCSHSITSLLEIGINLAVYGIWLLSYHFEASIGWQLYIVIIAAVILVWGTYFFLFNQVKHHTDTMHKLAYYSISTHLGHKNWWIGLQMLLDRREIVEKKPIEVKVKQPSHVIKFDSDPENYKDQDRKKILEFMKGKAEVYVDDIEKRSGADKLRVYPILFEGEMAGYIKIITRSGLGAPEIVTLADDVSF